MAQKQTLFTQLVNFSIDHFLKQTYPSTSRSHSKKRKYYAECMDLCHYTILQRGQSVPPITLDGKTPMIQWTLDMEKCIDATPIVIRSRNQSFAFIGSHSGLFIAAELNTGHIVWKTRLPDRIESSACIDDVNQLVIVGNVLNI
jgi:hypothetical protein